MSTGEKVANAAITVAGIGIAAVSGDTPGTLLQVTTAFNDFVAERRGALMDSWWKGVVTGENWEGETPQEIQGIIQAKLAKKAAESMCQSARHSSGATANQQGSTAQNS